MCPKTICNLYPQCLRELISRILSLNCFFLVPGDRGGLVLEAPLYNFQTSRDTATKITQNKIFSNV